MYNIAKFFFIQRNFFKANTEFQKFVDCDSLINAGVVQVHYIEAVFFRYAGAAHRRRVTKAKIFISENNELL